MGGTAHRMYTDHAEFPLFGRGRVYAASMAHDPNVYQAPSEGAQSPALFPDDDLMPMSGAGFGIRAAARVIDTVVGLGLGLVAGFGVATIFFALSTTMWLSLVALAAAGMFDGVSMVIRNTTLRMLSPEHLRGRIAAVNWIFIGSSNELGAFESGVAATLFGVVPAVLLGGLATLVVVGAAAVLAPQLRTLDLDPRLHPAESLAEPTAEPQAAPAD